MAYPTRKGAALRIAATLGVAVAILAAALLANGLLNTKKGPLGGGNSTADSPSPDGSATPAVTPCPYVVVVDAGHGGWDGGAVGVDTGVVEAGLDLAYALCLKEELNSRGFTVVLTRQDENALGATKREDMAARRVIMNESDADVVVSVHMNKFRDRSVSGPMAFYMKGSESGQALAEAVIDGVCASLGRSSRRANPGDYYVIRESVPPAVIIECGFLSNQEDEALIQTEEYRAAIVRGVADGVEAYFKALAGLTHDGAGPSPSLSPQPSSHP